ncbi:MAG: guanitoxin biosynthesis heme-dependent pre-guanitoxin N-hydroxylase GntA [Chthoniobacterales bacterium]|jgi:FPC/CPF motif-containing protein YcgG
MRTNSFIHEAEEAFRQFVARPEFPCLGAKAALNSNSETVRVFDELGNAESTYQLAAALTDFTRLAGRDAVEPKRLSYQLDGSTASRPTEYATFIAIFEKPRETDEAEFENLLWRQLRLLHERDRRDFDWDPSVSSNPADPHFSFSFGGQALYVIGLHANSSREARRFPWPTLVFNPHEQFERLRADGKWKHMQETIRQRDRHLQGTVNPMLSDFGERSEARQYSGRAVTEDWQPPFRATTSGKCPFAH